jgi:peptidoglycan/LPS O-acetylase OafA/YrhL
LFAYRLFLCHAPLGAFLQQHWNIWQPFVLLFASCALAASLILTVEIPFDRLRYRIRNVPHG